MATRFFHILFHAQMRGSWLTYYGIDFLSFTEVAGQLNFVEGQTFSSATAKVVIRDDLNAKSSHVVLDSEGLDPLGIYALHPFCSLQLEENDGGKKIVPGLFVQPDVP